MKKFALVALVVTMFAACSKKDIAVDILPDRLLVSIANNESRVHLNEDKRSVWDSGDMLSVFYKNSANGAWRYVGDDGANEGAIVKISEPNNPDATFTSVYAVYPYMENTTISDIGLLSINIPTEQTFLDGSYGKGDNIMVAIGDSDRLSMKNVFGWIRIPMTGTGQKISSLVFEGNNGEVLAGAATIDPYTQKITFAEGGTKSLTLNCNDVALEEGKTFEFYIAIAPQTFSKGFSVDILLANGDIATKRTTKSVTISRNHICPMAEVTNPTQTPPASNEIWYTSSDGAVVTPYATDIFGANIVSNTYNTTRQCWMIKFDDDLTSIGKNAFRGCSSLTTVTIPDSITSIGEEAFADCSSLTAFYGKFASDDNRCLIIDGVLNSFAPSGLTSYAIPDSVTEIGTKAFFNCRSLTSVTIPNSITKIGNHAFDSCSSLTSVNIPDSITEIGDGAFQHCSSLTRVDITDLSAWCQITFGSSDVSYWSGTCPLEYAHKLYLNGVELTDVTIPDNTTSIGRYAFYSCSSLKNITIPNSVTEIGYAAFYSCSSLTSITLPDSVTKIGGSAFSGCNSLTSVTIGNNVTKIENYTFRSCSRLTSVTIPNSVTKIGDGAFRSCSSLANITIPDNVASIGENAFYQCSSLKEVYCRPTAPPTGGSDMFKNNASDRKIYVPTASVAAYKAAEYWKNYTIEPYNF